MTGHNSRVLHLAQSPDGVTVCSAAADETLRFWKCFAEAAPAKVGAEPCLRQVLPCSHEQSTTEGTSHVLQRAARLADCPTPFILRHNDV